MQIPPMEWMERVIRIDSITDRSNGEIVRFLWPLLEESGLRVEEQAVVENGEPFMNLIAYNDSPHADDLLVLNTHLDTVSFGEASDWTKTEGNPFRATLVKDRIYGLGTADVKLDFLCKIMAARLSRPWKRPFALIGTFGEERGLVGAQHLLKEKRVRPKYALVGEPSNLELIYAHKGHMVVTLVFDMGVQNVRFLQPPKRMKWKGKAAHSSTPHLGKNAIELAFSEIKKKRLGIYSLEGGTDLNRIPDRCEALLLPQPTPSTVRLLELVDGLHGIDTRLRKKKDNAFNPATATLSINKIREEKGQLLITFDVRLLPSTNPEKLEKELQTLASRTGAQVAFLGIDAPLRGKKNSRLMKAATEALKNAGQKKVVAKTKASSTEAAVYGAHGAQAIVFGPGISVGNVHRPNEYNLISQIQTAVRFYTEMLRLTVKEL